LYVEVVVGAEHLVYFSTQLAARSAEALQMVMCAPSLAHRQKKADACATAFYPKSQKTFGGENSQRL